MCFSFCGLLYNSLLSHDMEIWALLCMDILLMDNSDHEVFDFLIRGYSLKEEFALIREQILS